MNRRIRDALRALLNCEHDDRVGGFCLKCGTKMGWDTVGKPAIDRRLPLVQELMDALFEKMVADMKVASDKVDAEIEEAGIAALAEKDAERLRPVEAEEGVPCRKCGYWHSAPECKLNRT